MAPTVDNIAASARKASRNTATGRAQRPGETNFTGALGHRNQHHIRYQNARHGRDQSQQCLRRQGSVPQQLVECGQHGILRDDSNVFFAPVTLLQNLANLIFRLRYF